MSDEFGIANDAGGKICTACLEMKPLSEFSLTDRSGRLRAACKKCEFKRLKLRILIKKAEKMNEAKFAQVHNGLSSVAKKIYAAVPKNSYWSAARIASELIRTGVKVNPRTLSGALNFMVKNGLLIEADQGLFSRERVVVAKPAEKITDKQMEIQMETNAEKNPFDAIREIAINLMDVAKKINELASGIDSKLACVEKQMESNELDTAKLKQLQTLLKSLG